MKNKVGKKQFVYVWIMKKYGDDEPYSFGGENRLSEFLYWAGTYCLKTLI